MTSLTSSTEGWEQQCDSVSQGGHKTWLLQTIFYTANLCLFVAAYLIDK